MYEKSSKVVVYTVELCTCDPCQYYVEYALFDEVPVLTFQQNLVVVRNWISKAGDKSLL